MIAYFEALRRNSIEKTLAFRDRKEFIEQMAALSQQIKASARDRNVHLVVLESFLDPKLFAGMKFTQSPDAPAFRKMVGKTDTYSISPVFGGGTAQAEFELLCGVPALRALSSVEFNVFTGVKTYCLPSILDDAGYQTMASNGHKPKFFNAIAGYKGTGFQNIFFPKENAPDMDTYLSTGNTKKEWYMFDGNLLSQNLDYVSRYLQEHPGQPIFNYIMTIYGHTPHYLDEAVRPRFIKVLSGQKKDAQLERAVNQHYYRTEAIATYVQGLLKIDPHSLIILVSDHIPPLTFGPKTYEKFQYMKNIDKSIYYNRIVIIENGKTMQYETMHHYDVPKVIANYLTDGVYCRNNQCSFVQKKVADRLPARDGQDDYMTIMAHATM
jgi:phosphoglycerol transferase MdoB-like AlkP superfamily enzyme